MLVRSAADGAGRARRRRHAPARRRRASTGTDPLAGFPPNAARHLRRTDGFPHVADIMVNSFYDPVTEEGCAFEELISFHGGMGGPQTQPFVLHPALRSRRRAEPLVRRRGACKPVCLQAAWREIVQRTRPNGRRRDDASRRRERSMCRWMAWLGQPVLIDELLFNTPHGIVDQSLHSRMGAETTNGDGFGLGWYGAGDGPGSTAASRRPGRDANLRELAGHIESPLFLAHVRAAIGSPVQQTNCHPFRHGRWLFVHNGYVGDFHALRRDLMLAIDPRALRGRSRARPTPRSSSTSRSRIGLEDDPIAALERTVGLVEESARAARRRRWSRGRSGSPTASRCGRCATRPRARHGRSSRRPTSTPSSSLPGQQALPRDARRRPADRLRALLGPAGRVGGDPAAELGRVASGGVFEHQDFRPLVPVG